MTCLISLRRPDGTYHREFCDVPSRVRIGESLSALGTHARITGIVRNTAPAGDPQWDEYGLEPKVEFAAEILAEPIVIKRDDQMRFEFERGTR